MIAGRLLLALLCAATAAACSSTLRFDDHSIDAGAPAEAGPSPDAPADGAGSCTSENCGFVGDSCTPTRCRWECPHFQSCTGRCGGACTADCEENSICMLGTGGGANLHCEEDARCAFIVGPASSVDCDRGSDCGTRCLGSCSLTCAAEAVCALACGEQSPLMSVTGSASCP